MHSYIVNIINKSVLLFICIFFSVFVSLITNAKDQFPPIKNSTTWTIKFKMHWCGSGWFNIASCKHSQPTNNKIHRHKENVEPEQTYALKRNCIQYCRYNPTITPFDVDGYALPELILTVQPDGQSLKCQSDACDWVVDTRHTIPEFKYGERCTHNPYNGNYTCENTYYWDVGE
ncbi:MAG: hypothetical protein OXC48_06990 [Endozoicomonadaceae bacterium]|nr:hypothetical protein [Endozoicomonadaceae bacterium]